MLEAWAVSKSYSSQSESKWTILSNVSRGCEDKNSTAGDESKGGYGGTRVGDEGGGRGWDEGRGWGTRVGDEGRGEGISRNRGKKEVKDHTAPKKIIRGFEEGAGKGVLQPALFVRG